MPHPLRNRRVVLASAVPYDPARLASARGWYEADRVPGWNVGSTLATLPDATSAANDATQGTAGSRFEMQTRGGVKVLRADGGDFMTIPASLSLNTRALTLFAAVYPTLRHNPSPQAYFGSQTGGVFVSLLDRLSNYNFFNAGPTGFPTGVDSGAYIASNYAGKVGGSDRFAPSVLMLQQTASQSTLRVNGLDQTGGSVVTSATMTGGTLGAFNAGTFFNGDLYCVGIFESMSDAERDAVYAWLLAKYGHTYTTQNLIVTLGDSLSQGVGTTSQLNEYPSQLVGLLNSDGKPYQLYNDARSGARITHVSTRLSTYVTPKYNASRTKNFAVLWSGSNDIFNSDSGATTYTNLSAVIATLKATGWIVVVPTMLPRSDVTAGKETQRGNFNAAILGNAAAANYVVDMTGIANLQNTADATYFSDTIHLTDAGYGLVAQAVHDAIAAGA